MTKILMLAISEIRKSKGQAVSFLLIIIMAGTLLNIGLNTLFGYSSLFEQKCQELNTAESSFLMNEADYSEVFNEYVKNSEKVADVEVIDAIIQLGDFAYGENTLSSVNVFMNLDYPYHISRYNMIEEAEEIPENPIYVPYVLKVSVGYELGDDFDINASGKVSHYKIAGFVEEMTTGAATSTNMGFFLKEEDFNKFREADEGIYKAKMINAKLKEHVKAPVFTAEVNNYMSEIPAVSTQRFSTDIEYVQFTRTGVASIGCYVFIGFAILIVIVSLILMHFRIRNSIEGDMENIGALKALGYTSNQLILSIMMQFAMLAWVGSILGIGLSYVLLPLVRDIFTSNSGMLWVIHFDSFSAVLTNVSIFIAVLSIAYLGSRRIKKLPPIIALRGGVLTHSFKKNVLPLDKARGNINVLMALKSFLQGIRQNMMILVIVVAVFFQLAFGMVFFYNAVIEEENFVKLVTGEIGDAMIVCNSSADNQELLSKIQEEAQVRKAFFFENAVPIMFQNPEMMKGSTYLCEDFSSNDNSIIYEGRSPIYNNEVALSGTSISEMGKEIGDTIQLTVGKNSFDYLITGYIQDGNGTYGTQMTYKGYQRLVPEYEPTIILVHLKEGESTPDFLDYVQNKYERKIAGTQNSKEQVYSIIRPMTDSMKMSICIIVAVTLCVIALILQMVIKTNLVRRKTELGIQKSLEFTTFQLMFQNALSLIPSFAIGTVTGATLAILFMNPVIGLMMRMAGIMKVNFEIPVGMLVGMGIGIIAYAFGISLLISMKLKKITAYSLISE